MKKLSRVLAIVLVLAMVLPGVAQAATLFAEDAERIEGANRYRTAVEASKFAYEDGAETVVLATGENYADALAGTVLAAKEKAPLLLTKTGAVQEFVLAEIARLGAEKVIVLGGTAAVSANVVTQLKDAGLEVERVAGDTRFDTAIELAGKEAKKAYLVSSQDYKDALAIGPVAGKEGAPILLTRGDVLNARTKAALKDLGVEEVVVVGGTAAVSAAVVNEVKALDIEVERVSGTNAIRTALAVAEAEFPAAKYVFVATNADYADGLVGGYLGAKFDGPVLLTNKEVANDDVKKYIDETGAELVILGGANAVSKKVANAYLDEGDALKVVSVSANTAKSFLVKFNKTVTDADKITFKVTRLSTELKVTPSWNEKKTEATLTSDSNLAEATFAVAVLKDGKEIAKEDVTITAQKLAKLEFTSKSVAVKLDGAKEGFVTYKVYDQYDNDITSSYLANNITFQSGAISGVGTIVGRNGLLTLTPDPAGTPLIQFPNISVVAYDTTSGLSATVTLPTSTAVGTLSDFVFGSAENLKLVEGDVTSVFYLPYTATDMSGNETKNYDLVKGGLILTGSGSDELVVSLPDHVSAKLVQDPTDSKKAAIEVKVKSTGTALAMDMPVTITALSYSGKAPAVIQTTIVKAKQLAKFYLLGPSETVAAGESPTLGYEAYDQFGNKITRYRDIVAGLGAGPYNGFTITEKVDGTAKVTMNSLPSKGLAVLSAVVPKTAHMTTLNINVQDAAKPARIALDTKNVITAMEHGAVQSLKIGDDDEIIVYDQYDRKMSDTKIDTLFSSGAAYKIDITGNTGDVTVGTATLGAVGTVALTANNSTGGSDTIKFELKDVTNSKVLSTVSTSFAVIKTTDITDYTLNAIEKPIYASNYETVGTITAKEAAYAATLKVYGKTAGGAKVLLNDGAVIGGSVDNTKDFTAQVAGANYNSVSVVGNGLDNNRTSAETLAFVQLSHNGKVSALSTKITSSTTAPVAKDIVAKGVSEDKITLKVTDFNDLNSKSVALYNTAGAAATKAAFWFEVKDSYDKTGMLAVNYNVVKDGAGGTTMSIADTGIITASGAATGDKVYVSAVTNNGLVKTIEVTIIAD